MGIKKVLKKLFDRGIISKKEVIENDYDLLSKILKDRAVNKKKISNLRRKSVELEAYLDILNDDSINKLYSSKELKEIYDNIIS
ncbi:hypothetical protein [Tenacibaculum maritimum]|uniref:hypothetical protein n=1 Tax=Tenacibaculum maritimum TaxID=107401 RepID=UPI0003F86C66|nr:hypothetical protein [Tenacibaculum maritimum]CAA0164848.1 conserved hypothetical protein [Tenacibaculum maritimum]CAA0216478.1 conserved hypothetical protein [Tenacibaculum maritimum]